MSRADIEAGVRAGLEAAAKCCGKKHHPADIAELIRALDPAAIAATVGEDEEGCELCDGPLDAGKVCVPCWNAKMTELLALREDGERHTRFIIALASLMQKFQDGEL